MMTLVKQPGADPEGLKRLYRLMNQVRTAIDPNVPAQLVQTFLAVALNEGKTLSEFSQMLGASYSTTSRHLLDLGDRNRKMEAGYKLVDRKQNPTNLRENFYVLSEKGKLLARQLTDLIEG